MTSLRRTGRTTRMIHEAVEAAMEGNGHYVFIIVHSQNCVKPMASMIEKLYVVKSIAGSRDKIYLDPKGEIAIVSKDDPNVNLHDGFYQGAHPSCKFFADHLAVEIFLHDAAPWAYKQFKKHNGIEGCI